MTVPAELAAMAAADAGRISQDKLDELRKLGERLRDVTREIMDSEQRLEEQRGELREIQFEKFPNLFDEAGVDRVGLPSSGNLPACDVVMNPYYKASIAAEWPEERKDAAYDFLVDQEAGDIIRVVVSVSFGKDQYAEAEALAKRLREMELAPTITRSVPWTTLTAWVKERFEKIKRPLTATELEKIGAMAGRRAVIKERK